MGVLPMFYRTRAKKSTVEHTGKQQQQQQPHIAPAPAAAHRPLAQVAAQRRRPVVPSRVLVHENKLGSGAYGSVQLGTVHDDAGGAHAVAVKMIAEDRMRPESLAREASILERLNGVDHPSTVNFYGWFKPGTRTVRANEQGELGANLKTAHCFVMERMVGGELFEYVLRRKGLSEVEAAPFLRQIAEGLHNAHTLGIAHRDLKLENVLFAGDPGPGGLLKLIDWGLAHQHEVRKDGSVVRELAHSRCGSRSYMAPEVVAAKERNGRRGPGYDAFTADVWSLGVCMFAMLVGFFPFDQADPAADWRARKCLEVQQAGGSVIDTIFGFYPRKRLTISTEAKQLLDSMFTFDASRRADLDQVLASRWLAPQRHHSLAALKQEAPAACDSRTASANSSQPSTSPGASESASSASRSSDSQQPTGSRASGRESHASVRLTGMAAKGSDSVSVSSVGSSARASVKRSEELIGAPRWSIVA